jgi:rhodanese-related sulfurtransferase
MKAFVTAVVAATALLTVGACSSPPATGVLAGATVIDVRTPAEYAAGHLSGAVNVDVESPDFATKIAALDVAGTYLVYCRTGNRAAVAKSEMGAKGFTRVTNLGGIDAAAATTGLSVVTH